MAGSGTVSVLVHFRLVVARRNNLLLDVRGIPIAVGMFVEAGWDS